MEDQSHISPLPRSGAGLDGGGNQPGFLEGHRRVRSFPGAFTWSLTSSWGGFGGWWPRIGAKRSRSTEMMCGSMARSPQNSRLASLSTARSAAADARPV